MLRRIVLLAATATVALLAWLAMQPGTKPESRSAALDADGSGRPSGADALLVRSNANGEEYGRSDSRSARVAGKPLGQPQRQQALASLATPAPEAALAPGEAVPRGDEVAQGDDALTAEQDQVITMYESLAQVFERADDCEHLSAEVTALIERHEQTVARWAATQAALGPEAMRAEQDELEVAAKARLARVRDAFRSGLARCAGTPALNAAIAKLAALGSGA